MFRSDKHDHPLTWVTANYVGAAFCDFCRVKISFHQHFLQCDECRMRGDPGFDVCDDCAKTADLHVVLQQDEAT